MHIVIGVISALAGLIWALNRLQNSGVDLNAFNPFTWMRRRKWEKQLGTRPIHGLTDSMEAAALLVTAIANEEGEITRETKKDILSIFENEFGIARSKSLEMFSSSTYLLRDEMNVAAEVKKILKPTISQFDQNQKETLFKMMVKASELEGAATQSQLSLLESTRRELGLEQQVGRPGSAGDAEEDSRMSQNEFWRIVARGLGSNEPDSVLRGELDKLPAENVAAFQKHFDALFDSAYRWDLWGAAYIINGGCSDDGFIDFRYALIAKGKEIFTKALADPDSLVNLGAGMEIDDEAYGYVAMEVYESKTGQTIPRESSAAREDNMGEEWDFDDLEENKKRLPRLSAMFS